MGRRSFSWREVVEALEESILVYEEGSGVASLGTLQRFREKAANLVVENAGEIGVLLDGGVGPGEMAKTILAKFKPKIVLGLDFSVKMLKQACRRLKDLGVEFYPIRGVFEYPPLRPQTIDLTVFSFSLRDALNMKQTLSETKKILKPNGLILILDIGKPRSRLLRATYGFYWLVVAPLMVKVKLGIKGRNPWKEIYPTYQRLPSNSQLKQMISENFKVITFREYYLGCVVIALAIKSTSCGG